MLDSKHAQFQHYAQFKYYNPSEIKSNYKVRQNFYLKLSERVSEKPS